jgi:beta-glucanase (GH16 family)
MALGKLRGSRAAAVMGGTLALLVTTALMVAPASGLTNNTGKAATSSTTAPNCQGSTPLGMSGNWTCSFDDEFNGTSLNPSLWQPQLTATSFYTAGDDCYVNNPNTISESGGNLNLSVVKVPAGTQCVGTYYEPPNDAGMVTTRSLFTQTYGAYEVNAKLPAATVQGLQETFWLYPQNLTYGAWPASGEIDFAEFYSLYPGYVVPYVHYNYTTSDPHAYNACTINQGQFNTYGLQWTATTLTTYVNGTPCLTDTWLHGPAPFNQPFFIALTQALGVNSDALTSSTPFPDTTQVNWVRAWKAGS